jgi:hypothetical protein
MKIEEIKNVIFVKDFNFLNNVCGVWKKGNVVDIRLFDEWWYDFSYDLDCMGILETNENDDAFTGWYNVIMDELYSCYYIHTEYIEYYSDEEMQIMWLAEWREKQINSIFED